MVILTEYSILNFNLSTQSVERTIDKIQHEHSLDVHESVHRDIIMNTTNEIQLYRLIYYS
jgi:hypothetical protein